MESNFTHYYFLLSCPSDVQDDIKDILQVFSDVNKNVGEPNHIHLVSMFWKDDAIPAAGEAAQDIINTQLLQKADGVIALFWTHFGTPTDKYGSGTEEEITRAIHDKKDVLLYCSKRPIEPSKLDENQYAKVTKFQDEYCGLFSSYSSKAELKTKLTNALTALIFKYREKQGIDSGTADKPGKIPKYSVSEYYDLGWFLGRAHFEEPEDDEFLLAKKFSSTPEYPCFYLWLKT